jgi:hypothetical protein
MNKGSPEWLDAKILASLDRLWKYRGKYLSVHDLKRYFELQGYAVTLDTLNERLSVLCAEGTIEAIFAQPGPDAPQLLRYSRVRPTYQQVVHKLSTERTFIMSAIIHLWPRRETNQAVEIVHTEYSDTHCFELTADGVLTISLDEQLLEELADIPEFIERTRDSTGTIALNAHGIRVLKRFLDSIE